MKNQIYSLFFLLFSLSFYGQNDSINKPKPQLSVVSADKMNVVYRGMPNPISIAVNDAKSYTISGDEVSFEEGKYVVKPGIGTETKVIVEIEKLDGSKVIEEHVFRIKGLPAIEGILNSNCCYVSLKREDILKSIISTQMTNFFMIEPNSDFFKVHSFEISFPSKKTIKVEGNTFNIEAFKEINKLKKGKTFEINRIDYGPSIDGLKKRPLPIEVILED